MSAFNGSAAPVATAAESRADVLALALEQAGYEVKPKAGGGYMTACPAHDDETPSLSVDPGDDGRALVFCHAGCANEEVLAPIDWKPGDLFAGGRKRAAGKGRRVRVKAKPPEPLGEGCEQLVADWHASLTGSPAALGVLATERAVTDDVIRRARLGSDGGRVTIPHYLAGRLVNVERYVPRHLRGGGPGLIAEPGRTRWLYEPEQRTDDLVLVCEASMDALAVLSQTGLRVAAAPSASVWRDEWSGQLRASGVRRAAVVYDADDAGRKGAEVAERSLRAAGIAAWRIDVDPGPDERDPLGLKRTGYDATDFVREHGGDALRALLFEAGDSLLDSLRDYFARYLVASRSILDVLPAWAVHTHAVGAFDATPYLAVASAEPGSGKTRLLEALELVVARPWLTGRATAAVLPRKIQAERPTLLLDESDNAFGGDRDYAAALLGVLNTGYKPSGRTTVCVGQGADLTYADFSTFCPKAFAGLGKLPDTVRSRSIPVRLKRRARDESVASFRAREAEAVAAPLRTACQRWAAQHEDALRDARPEAPGALDGRAADIAEPLLAVADRAGGEWPQRVRDALAELLTGDEQADGQTTGVRLLADVRRVFGGHERMFSRSLVQLLIGMDESRWADVGYGRPLTANTLASMLGEYGVGSRTIRNGEATGKGYLREQFEDAWSRYLPPASPQTKRHNVTNGLQSQESPFLNVTKPSSCDGKKPPFLAVQADCDVVTAENGGRAVTDASSGPARAPVNAFGEPYRPVALASSNGRGHAHEATE